MGLGDPIHKNSYLAKYKLSRVLPSKSYDENKNVDHKNDNENRSSHITKNTSFLFNTAIDFITEGLYTVDQWEYFSSYFIFYESFHQIKDIHANLFKAQSEISKTACVQSLVENE